MRVLVWAFAFMVTSGAISVLAGRLIAIIKIDAQQAFPMPSMFVNCFFSPQDGDAAVVPGKAMLLGQVG